MHLRKFLLALCALIVFYSPANAQAKMGIEAGPAFPRLLDELRGNNAYAQSVQPNTQSVVRFYGGFFADIPLGKKEIFTLRPRLLYMGGGGEVPAMTDYSGNLLVPHIIFSLNYIDLPVQLLYTPSFSFGKPWIGAGLYPGILISGTAQVQGASQSLNIGSQSNDDVKRFDFGFNATAGLAIKGGVLIGVDFQQGLVSIAPPPPSYSGNPRLNTRNSMWGVHIAYEWKPQRSAH